VTIGEIPRKVIDLSDKAVRRSFDAIADLYVSSFASELERKPYDRALLDSFAQAVEVDGPIADLGCGPGHVGAYLAKRGHWVIGCDFSVQSLLQGRRLFPTTPLVAGDLLSLPFADGSLGGAVAFYSLIYGEESQLTRCLEEIRRVLRRRGALLAAVHGGVGADHFDSYEGRPIDLTIVARDPDRLAKLASGTGFRVEGLNVREPYEFEHQTPRVYLRASAS
jgi:SAM-dependent methyltransferase